MFENHCAEGECHFSLNYQTAIPLVPSAGMISLSALNTFGYSSLSRWLPVSSFPIFSVNPLHWLVVYLSRTTVFFLYWMSGSWKNTQLISKALKPSTVFSLTCFVNFALRLYDYAFAARILFLFTYFLGHVQACFQPISLQSLLGKLLDSLLFYCLYFLQMHCGHSVITTVFL